MAAPQAAGPNPDAVFAALADPTRRRLLERLSGSGPISVSQLAAEFPVTRQAVSKHLTALAGAGLVTTERRGRERMLTFAPAPLDEAAAWIATLEARWDVRLAALARYLTEEAIEQDG